MYKAFHFYQVFNPMLNEQSLFPTQAHEFYYELKKRYSENQGESNFLHWGKVSVAEAQENIEAFKTIVDRNKQNGVETHLYLSDYHHFWVAKVSEIKTELVDNVQTLPFYENKNVSVWFKIEDFDLLSAEFSETSHYLSMLYLDNEFSEHKIERLNPYIGGLHFPLIVQDYTLERYFSQGLRVARKNMLIENPSHQAKVREQVTSFVLPPHIFKQLSFEGQQAILNSEQTLGDVKVSLQVRGQVFSNYISVLEESLNLVVGSILRESFGDSLWISESGDQFAEGMQNNFIKMSDYQGPIKLSGYLNLLATHKGFGNLSMEKIEKDYPEVIKFFVNELKPFLENGEIVLKQHHLENGQDVSLCPQEVFALRNFVLGVGCLGVVNTLLNQRIIWQGNSKLLVA